MFLQNLAVTCDVIPTNAFPPRLISLIVRNTSFTVTDLSVFAPLTDLIHLDFSQNSFYGSLAPLANLTRLQYLNASFNVLQSDLKPLSLLTQLQQLDLERAGGRMSFMIPITGQGDLQPLARMTRLLTLNVQGA